MTEQELFDMVEERVHWTLTKLKQKGYPVIDVHYQLKSFKKAGLAGVGTYYTKKNSGLITISREYLKENTEQMIEVTVPHEVAHIYVGAYYKNAKQVHGPEFRHVMRQIGVDPSTHHSMKRPEGLGRSMTKFVYTCPCHKEFFLSPRLHKGIQDGNTRYCKSCKKDIIWTGTSKKVVR